MDFSKGSVYIYIYRVYSAKVAMSSRPIGFHGTRYNKRPVVSFVRSSLSGGPIFSRLESVSGQGRNASPVLRERPRREDRVDRFRPTDR